MRWTVIENTIETPMANTITFSSDKRVDFKAGQFFLLEAFIDGKKVKRAYSVSNGPGRQFVKVTSKLSENPNFSKMLREIQEGDFVEAHGPFGKFSFERGDADKLVLIAGGSGIAPMVSMIHYCEDEGLHIPVTVLFSSKTQELIMMKDELDKLDSRHSWLTVHHTLTQEKWDGLMGRIDLEMINRVVKDIGGSTFYICGPPKMVNIIQRELIEAGHDPSKIKTERYN